ncbi:GDP-mannose-dependent alpha-mannosyltransferase [Aquisphaera giovannonii]|uniref:GDP-mannose-dependent alpha-mannosyltransferase n=1 Tax=Aquisphaera giovannonii TaxID=406548 RepID=A0A5B9W1Y1_9BACT|nr:glycosyltransferase [Aquisphaera giovannonii]QEH34269.1 GDP-mannose-dependent alpha-mannosyltransferase [Aquisphaera giovannonii]
MPNRTDLDTSVVITAHREGWFSHRTLRSVRRAVAFAAERGVNAEVVAVLDRPDALTRSFFRDQADVRCHEVDLGDRGAARNFGVRQSTGRYINPLDGEDLLGRTWLWKAFCGAERAGHPAAWTPEISVIFEDQIVVWRHPSSDDPDFRPERLVDDRQWLPSLLVPREIALRIPFAECPLDSGFGSEDWHWHCELLAAGVAIRAVEGTTFFRRRCPTSRSEIHSRGDAIHPPTRLFDPQGMVLPEIRLARTAAEEAHEVERVMPIEEQPPTEPAPARPRSSLKVAYRSLVKPYVPASFDSALRRLYLSTFPMGGKQWARGKARAIRSGAGALARRAAGRSGEAEGGIVPSWPQELPQSHPAPASDQAPANPTFPHPADHLPGWLVEDWKDIHSVEPHLFPSREQLGGARWGLEAAESPVGAAYADACRRLGEPWPSHVFLVPWLTTGGSDLTALNYVHALHDQRQAARIAMLATEDRDSTWADRLPPGVDFLPIGQLYRDLSFPERKALLVRLLLQMKPRMIHNLNSWVGNEAFISHGKALSQNSHLVGHVFCYDMTREGQRVGYPVNHAPRYFDVASAVISDNQTLLDEMQEIYGLDPARLLAHYQPVVLKERRPPRVASSTGPLKILWAGRLDYQKRVDVLNAIADACAGEDFEIHAYGSHVLDRDTPFPQGPNLTYHGPYNGFESLPAHEFDVFLYTSQWDGLPNVLQEAMSRGLVVVASSAGGVKELIRPGETGYLIDPFDDVQAYRAALREVDRDRAGAARMVWEGYRRLLDQHSPERFARDVAATPGYRSGPLRAEITAA